MAVRRACDPGPRNSTIHQPTPTAHPPTRGLRALAQLVDDCAQCEQALVDGRPLLHALTLCPGLGDAL
jgi:hypothetical protein